jgi:hypothetical protein
MSSHKQLVPFSSGIGVQVFPFDNGAKWLLSINRHKGVLSEMAFYEKVIKVKADVAAYLISCFPSA